MAEIIDIQIKSNIPQAEGDAGSLRKQMRELRKEIDGLEVGTDEYNAALQRLANTMHEYKDEQEMVRNSAGDLGTAIANVQSLGTGLASGFSAVNAIMTLTGSNSEALQQAMVNLQAGIALVQGLKGMEGFGKTLKATIASIKSLIGQTKLQTAANKVLATSNTAVATTTKGVSVAMKGLKAALVATGIGAIAVLVGELVSGLSKLFDWVSKNVKAQNEFKDTNEKLTTSFDKQNDALDLQIKYMEADGKSTKDIINAKLKLISTQKAETAVAVDNAKARLNQLKADSAWVRFWKGENKIIKELEEETIPELEKTLESLNKQEASLNADLYKATKEEAKKAGEAAKKVAEDIAKDAKKAGEDLKKQLDDTVKKFAETIKSINSISKTLDIANTKTIDSAVTSDIDAWMTVYGTDPKKMQQSLTGTLNALIGYAYDEASKIRDAALKKAKTEAEKTEIANVFTESIEEIYNAAYPEAAAVGINLATSMVEGFTDRMTKSKSISETFTEQFNALNHLYNQGIIDYKEFYDTLINIQNDYQSAVADFEAQYIDETKMTEEYVAQLRYQYALKPLDFQKEVGEKFLAELDKQINEIDKKTQEAYNEYNLGIISYLMSYRTKAQEFYADNFASAYQSEIQRLEFEKQTYDAEYQAKVEHIQAMLQLNTLTTEQEAELNAQLDQLYQERLARDIEYYSNTEAARKEYMQNLNAAVTQGIDAMGDLSSNLANVFKEAAETMKDADGNYTAEGKRMLETSAALQIATATMTAAAGIATVWAQSATLGPIAGPVVAGIQTAAHIANLIVQIMSIKKALAQGLAGNTSGGAEAQSVDTSFTLTSPDAYQNTLSDEVQTDLQANTQNNQRVYVVSSDITDAQDSEKTTVTTSTF